MRQVLVLAFIVSVSIGSVANAQNRRSDGAERSLAAPANLTFGAAAGVPTGEPQAGTPRMALQLLLDGTKEGKAGTVALGWKQGQQNHFLLNLAGPLDDNDEATPISLLGLPTGASIKLSMSRLNWRGPTAVEQSEIQRLCTDLAKRGISPCQTDNEKIPLPERTTLRRLLHVDDRPWIIGADGGAERTTFRFLNRGTLDPGSESKTIYTASARLGYYSGAYGFLLGSYAYRRDYVPGGGQAEVCKPIEGTTALRCQPAVIGAPRSQNLSIASVELRKFFAVPIAVTPSLQRDFENDVTAVEVPLYFLRSGSSLTGGVRFGWRSDVKEVTAAVFVGTALGLLPQ